MIYTVMENAARVYIAQGRGRGVLFEVPFDIFHSTEAGWRYCSYRHYPFDQAEYTSVNFQWNPRTRQIRMMVADLSDGRRILMDQMPYEEFQLRIAGRDFSFNDVRRNAPKKIVRNLPAWF